MRNNIYEMIDSAKRLARHVMAETKQKLKGFRCVLENSQVVPFRGCMFCAVKIEGDVGEDLPTGIICSNCFEAIAESKEQCADWEYCPICGAKHMSRGSVGTITFFTCENSDSLPDELRPHGDFA